MVRALTDSRWTHMGVVFEAVSPVLRDLVATWLGRPYDLRFRWDDQALYCSELAYKLFERSAGVRLGKLERAADMNLDDRRVQQALRKGFANAKFDPAEARPERSPGVSSSRATDAWKSTSVTI
jgi:hypothetical protein